MRHYQPVFEQSQKRGTYSTAQILRATARSLLLVSTSLIGSTAIVSAQDATPATYEGLVKSLRELEADQAMVATVSNLVIERDLGRIELSEGQIALTTPMAGSVVAAVFVGSGVFTLTPPTYSEQLSLMRYEMDPQINERIKTAVFFFTDETLAELQSELTFGAGERPKDANKEIEEAIKYLTQEEDDHFDPYLLTAIANSDGDGIFYAHMAESRGDPLLFTVNPFMQEGVIVAKKADESRRKSWETVAQFASADQATSQGTADEPMDQIEVDLVRMDSYEIDISINEDVEFAAVASFDITPTSRPLQWIPLMLYWELEVESVTTDAGAAVSFGESEEKSYLWVGLDNPLAVGETQRLTVTYSGKLLDWIDVWDTGPGVALLDADAFLIQSRSTSTWYPRNLGRQRSTFDLTFHTPERFRTAAAGQKVLDEVADGIRTTQWQGEGVRNAGFNLGEFNERPIYNSGGIEITMQIDEGFHEQLSADLSSSRIPGIQLAVVPLARQRDMAGAVGKDVSDSFNFFSDVFGPSPVTEFYATEIPGSHGEAFPGMIHLFWGNFQLTDAEGGSLLLRAHEVAHQWWGIGVDYSSYRDRWLSEGMSEFSARWFLGSVRNQQENLYKWLDASAEAIRDARDPGPLSLGNRVSSRKRPENYSVMVYEKGSWAVHMLRYMMMDLDRLSDDRFVAMMTDFYQSHAGGTASTEDFQRVAEQHFGESLDWFFNQWFDGLALPKYKFSYSVAGSGTTYSADLTIEQSEVPPSFRMYVPVEIEYANGASEYRRVLVEGPTTEVTLEGLRSEPARIRFNAFMAVLVEDIDGEEWRWEQRR